VRLAPQVLSTSTFQPDQLDGAKILEVPLAQLRLSSNQT